MIRRLYINNYRCLVNFELPTAGKSSVLLIGKNGAGKTTISYALQILQKIARGTNRVAELARPKDFAQGQSQIPMRFVLEVDLDGKRYEYTVAFELPSGWKELRVHEESLTVDGTPVYTRQAAKVVLAKAAKEKEVSFFIDWFLVALPIVQQSRNDSISAFKQWLARVLIISPVPSLIGGDSQEETLSPNRSVSDFAAWFSGLLAHAPSSYSIIDSFLKPLMPDLKDIRNPETGTDSRSIELQFANDQESLRLPFGELSDGEKCFMICSLVIAANDAYGPLLCFWDEPDNHLSLSEVGHFVLALRKAFRSGGQFIATSHNPETIRSFSDQTTLVLDRKSHMEPTTIRLLSTLQLEGDLVTALLSGDMEL